MGWILATGIWRDTGTWNDVALWNDTGTTRTYASSIVQQIGGGKVVVKPIDAILDYPITWGLSESETISTSAWTVYPTETGGLAVVTDSEEIADATVSCLVEDGVIGHLYELTNTISTSEGRTDSRTITIRIGIAEAVQ